MKKSAHGKERQKLRLMSDYTIWKTITFGKVTPVDGKLVYQWGPKLVVVGEEGRLVTCHPGDVPVEHAKVLPFSKGQAILEKLNTPQIATSGEEEISFDDYMTGAWLKRAG